MASHKGGGYTGKQILYAMVMAIIVFFFCTAFFEVAPKINKLEQINSFQSSVAIHEETSHLLCGANQMTGFYKKG